MEDSLDPILSGTAPPVEGKTRKRRTKAQILEELNAKISLGIATSAERDKLQAMSIAAHQSMLISPGPSSGISIPRAYQREPSVAADFDLEKKKSDKNPRFEKEDYENVVTYLENPINFSSIFGSGKKTSVTGQSMTRGTALNLFAAHINTLFNSRKRSSQGTGTSHMDLNGNQLRQRLNKLKNIFSRAKNWANSTGAGVNEADNAKGIFTIAQTQAQMCPCYDRLEMLFGSKPNITPLALFDSGLTPTPSVPEGQEDDSLSDRDPNFWINTHEGLSPNESANVSSVNPRSESPPWPDSLIDSPAILPRRSEQPPSQFASSDDSLLEKESTFEPSMESPVIHSCNYPSSSKANDLEEKAQSGLRKKPISLAGRPLDPLPPLHASSIKAKELKNPLATALATSTEKKLDVFERNSLWRQKHEEDKLVRDQVQASAALKLENKRLKHEEEKIVRDQARATAALEWEKERFHLEQAERLQSKRLELEQAERLQSKKIDLLSRLIEQGKSKDEIDFLLRLCS